MGGIFDKPARYRATHRVTPETILVEGLEARGVETSCAGHNDAFEPAIVDVVHVHHLGQGALRAALDPSETAFAYTHHRPFIGLPSRRTKVIGVDAPDVTVGDFRAGAAARLVIGCADMVVALSTREALVHRDLYRVPLDREVVIPNGVPPAAFECSRSPADPPEILYVGQLVPFKRVDLLLDAVALLSTEVTVRLIYQVDDLRVRLEDQVRRLGLAENVIFEGPKSADEISQLLRRATALALPSAMEALPSVLTESMLAGVPVVAADVGGIRDQVGQNGYVVRPGSPQALATALDRVISDRALWRARADGIRADATARFSVERMVDDHLAMYEKILSRPGCRRRHRKTVTPWRWMAGITSQPRDRARNHGQPA